MHALWNAQKFLCGRLPAHVTIWSERETATLSIMAAIPGIKVWLSPVVPRSTPPPVTRKKSPARSRQATGGGPRHRSRISNRSPSASNDGKASTGVAEAAAEIARLNARAHDKLVPLHRMVGLTMAGYGVLLIAVVGTAVLIHSIPATKVVQLMPRAAPPPQPPMNLILTRLAEEAQPHVQKAWQSLKVLQSMSPRFQVTFGHVDIDHARLTNETLALKQQLRQAKADTAALEEKLNAKLRHEVREANAELQLVTLKEQDVREEKAALEKRLNAEIAALTKSSRDKDGEIKKLKVEITELTTSKNDLMALWTALNNEHLKVTAGLEGNMDWLKVEIVGKDKQLALLGQEIAARKLELDARTLELIHFKRRCTYT